jgi:predicted dehydrogenase
MKKPFPVQNQSRREFIAKSGLAFSGLTILPSFILGGKNHPSPNDKLNIAGIGVGGMGKNYLNGAATENFVALCDVDEVMYKRMLTVERIIKGYKPGFLEKIKAARYYRDFREMLDKEENIDAVMIGTPDHTHTTAALAAIAKGLHVYCAKPLTRTIYESRVLAAAAKKAGIASQMSTQSDANEEFRIIREWINDGAIGDVYEVQIWCDRPIWPQGIDRPKEIVPVPDTLDWNLFIGPAPLRPYHPAYHPFKFRGWFDFGTGALGDMGCHFFNPVVKALKLGYPTSVEASSTKVFPETYPIGSIVNFEFPARGKMPPVKLTWCDGGLKPERPKELERNREFPSTGILFRGSEGVILCDSVGDNPRLIPETKMNSYKKPAKTEERSIGHYEEWVGACKGGKPAGVEFGYGSMLTEIVLLGNLAIRAGKKLDWDGINMKVTNDENANKLVREPYNNGWVL